MKKIYQTPEVTLWPFGPTKIIAVSPDVSVNPDTKANDYDPVLVKRGSTDFWDDDWPEE